MYKLITIWLLCIGIVQAQTPTNSPYKLHWGVETGIGSAAIGTNLAYFFLAKKLPKLDSPSIMLLDPQTISRFDRIATRYWSKPIARASDALMFTSFAAPAFLFIDKDIRKDYLKIGTIWAETFALTAGITNLTKVLVHRTRPYVYNSNAPMHDKMERDARYSFFSGHTSMTASMSFMTAKIYTDYHPKSKWLPLVWTSAAILPAVTGLLRVRAGKHFPTDVILGYVVGAGIGVLVPSIHKWINK